MFHRKSEALHQEQEERAISIQSSTKGYLIKECSGSLISDPKKEEID